MKLSIALMLCVFSTLGSVAYAKEAKKEVYEALNALLRSRQMQTLVENKLHTITYVDIKSLSQKESDFMGTRFTISGVGYQDGDISPCSMLTIQIEKSRLPLMNVIPGQEIYSYNAEVVSKNNFCR